MNKILLVLLTILSVNCLSFRSGEYKNTEPVRQYEAPQNPVVKVNLKYHYLVDDAHQPVTNQALLDS
ncbi:hypothetical protein EHQ59_10985 [Leptospira kemamanensis]|uniref:Uncharacterized protein n=1 Tax=Leptospira kemamanensis TaxID=2484942 RepID=A0A4R9JQL6_9LEPT|nr:hypothetical protein [Leptospira kemamanensis]TGL51415.1 hypothetical protein EHQ59_10985 [Leptospira kemamanensis]